ncbi:GntR family transcriptional regulator [Brucella thiophenivorans]|uniref:FCD domain protein n=1 Tax=Brucella thiophenivorans TaxID=571255 RepID=A0A256FBW1_9HYPH|nr:GntR family transcriptional regulator [Brucella thiophenivorans]OYR12273.1 FCD domain protein [Brucella thiophenivorans]
MSATQVGSQLYSGQQHGREKNPGHPLGDEIYDALLADLISLRIPPGERLSVDALARHFTVSQTPIRAALIRLESEGLVIQKFNSGFSAAPLPEGRYFRDTYAFREMIEPELAMLAASRVTPEDIIALEELCTEMSCLAAESRPDNFGAFAERDNAFHTRITLIAGNQVAAEALSRLYIHSNLFRLRYHSTITTSAVSEHLEILDALRQKDAESARNLMRRHIGHSRERVEPFFTETENFPENQHYSGASNAQSGPEEHDDT